MRYLAVNTQVIFPKSKSGRTEFQFNSVSSFKVESSWQNLSDIAEIVLAKKLFFEEKGKVFELIKVGDPVILRGLYNGEMADEFTGFVAEIHDDLPVMIRCEDNMFLLKRTPVHKSYTSVKLSKLLADIVPAEFSVDAMDVELGSLLLSKTTVSQVLQMLKDSYGIYSYFVGSKLVSGKIYLDNPHNEVVSYEFTKNVISNDLKYRRKEDILLKVTMTSYLSDGTKKTVTVGDAEGQEQKLVCSNISSESEIKKLAQKELDRLKIDGYSGGLTTYGIPYVRHGYTAEIENHEFPERSGFYYVDAVTTTLSDKGAYRRSLKIGLRAADQ